MTLNIPSSGFRAGSTSCLYAWVASPVAHSSVAWLLGLSGRAKQCVCACMCAQTE